MSFEFWLGLAIIPAVTLAYLALGWLLNLSRKAWKRIDKVFTEKVILAKRVDPFDDQYNENEWAANRVRDALLLSPRMRTFAGFGWRVLIVRDGNKTRKAEPQTSDSGAS